MLRAVHSHERRIIVLHGKIQTQAVRLITVLHVMQPSSLCTGCLGIQCCGIVLLAAAPVGLRCSKFTASVSFNSDCMSELKQPPIWCVSSNCSLGHWC